MGDLGPDEFGSLEDHGLHQRGVGRPDWPPSPRPDRLARPGQTQAMNREKAGLPAQGRDSNPRPEGSTPSPASERRAGLDFRPCDKVACNWVVWPETDGQEQRCLSCGAYRKTVSDSSMSAP